MTEGLRGKFKVILGGADKVVLQFIGGQEW